MVLTSLTFSVRTEKKIKIFNNLKVENIINPALGSTEKTSAQLHFEKEYVFQATSNSRLM
jgi:hypothetical protein